jgi:hypothetical protein
MSIIDTSREKPPRDDDTRDRVGSISVLDGEASQRLEAIRNGEMDEALIAEARKMIGERWSQSHPLIFLKTLVMRVVIPSPQEPYGRDEMRVCVIADTIKKRLLLLLNQRIEDCDFPIPQHLA